MVEQRRKGIDMKVPRETDEDRRSVLVTEHDRRP